MSEKEPLELLNTFKCFCCGKWFNYGVPFCQKCGWLKCPYCNACLCNLGDEGKRVAQAMWEEYIHFVNHFDKKALAWFKREFPTIFAHINDLALFGADSKNVFPIIKNELVKFREMFK